MAATHPDPLPSIREREVAGQAARRRRPRSAGADWTAAADRPDPLELLAAQERDRVAALLPLRHSRMGAGAFAFYRGSAVVMAADLATMPASGLTVQLSGDAHLGNFGIFAAPDRRLVFDLNDFDETMPGPFEWDVLRLATSFVLAGREGAAGEDAGRAAAEAAARTYRLSMRDNATVGEVGLWYARDDQETLLSWAQGQPQSRGLRSAIQTGVASAARSTVASAVEHFTRAGRTGRRFRDEPPALMRIPPRSELAALARAAVAAYRVALPPDRATLVGRYRVADVGHKIVGVGSVGLIDVIVLLEGALPDDTLILQVKQARPSALAAFLPADQPARTHAERVVLGARLSLPDTDFFLGPADGTKAPSCYVRQLRDCKWAPDAATMSAAELADYAQLCGHALARGHARTGDAVAIAAYLGSGSTFDQAAAQFARRYAKQVAADSAAHAEAIRSGRLPAASTVPAAALLRGLTTGMGG